MFFIEQSYMSNNDNLPSLALIMNTYSALGGNDEQMGAGNSDTVIAEIKLFLSKVPAKLRRELRAAILSDDRDRALALSCGYVVKFFEYVPLVACKYHGTFVYELLKDTMGRLN